MDQKILTFSLNVIKNYEIVGNKYYLSKRSCIAKSLTYDFTNYNRIKRSNAYFALQCVHVWLQKPS